MRVYYWQILRSLYNNRKDASIIIVSIAVMVGLALFVFSSPPQSEDEKRDQREEGDEREVRDEKEAGFSSLAPLYLGFSEPKIAHSENDIYLVWNNITSENTEDIFFRLSLDGGHTFGASENLSNIPGNSTDPQIATYGNSTYVVWQDDADGNEEIYLKISPAGKSGFGRIFNLSRNEGNSTDPQIAIYGNTTYVVWQDDADGNEEIFLKTSPAGKSGFGKIFNLSKNEGNSTDPQIATYGNSAYVVWQDDTNGNGEILSARINSEGPKLN